MFGGCSGSILPSIKLTLQWLISVSNQIQIQIIGVKAGDGLMLGWAENISNWLAFSRSCWHLVGKWVSSVERRHQLCSRLERQSVPKTMPFNWCQPWRVYLQLQLYFLSPFPLFFLFFLFISRTQSTLICIHALSEESYQWTSNRKHKTPRAATENLGNWHLISIQRTPEMRFPVTHSNAFCWLQKNNKLNAASDKVARINTIR